MKPFLLNHGRVFAFSRYALVALNAILLAIAQPMWAQDERVQDDLGNHRGVIFPVDRMEPEEEGYDWSYQETRSGITTTIDAIQTAHIKSLYFALIDDLGKAEMYREEVAHQIAVLKNSMEDLSPWLTATLPPETLAKAHMAFRNLARGLQKSQNYETLNPLLCEVYMEANRAKLVMYGREAHEVEQEQDDSHSRISVVYRPFFLPIVYNVTTGKWSISVNIPTPLGSVTLSEAPPRPQSSAPGPKLVKIVLGHHNRYVVLRPGTTISFQKEELRVLSFGWVGDSLELDLEPIRAPRSISEVSKPDELNFETVRKALPVRPDHQ